MTLCGRCSQPDCMWKPDEYRLIRLRSDYYNCVLLLDRVIERRTLHCEESWIRDSPLLEMQQAT
jgi:hypothetical protein